MQYKARSEFGGHEAYNYARDAGELMEFGKSSSVVLKYAPYWLATGEEWSRKRVEAQMGKGVDLREAAEKGETLKVVAAIIAGADVIAADETKWTPLHDAALSRECAGPSSAAQRRTRAGAAPELRGRRRTERAALGSCGCFWTVWRTRATRMSSRRCSRPAGTSTRPAPTEGLR